MINAKPSDESLGFVFGFVTAQRSGAARARKTSLPISRLAENEAPNKRVL